MKSVFPLPRKYLWLLAILALLPVAPSFADEKTFTEVRSPNFRVLTDGSDHQARRIAREFEEMRAVFAIAFPNMRLSTGAPLLIFAVQSESGMKALAPAMWKDSKGPKPAGLFQHGWERQFAIVRLDQDIPGAYNVVYHEYVHSLLHSNFRWLPTWLDEGLAEFYGNTRFDSKKLYVGAPSLRVEYLKGRPMIPLETLLTVNPYSYYRDNQDRIDVFYAESWALVHFMVFGPDMDKGKKLGHFYTLLQGGEPQPKAFHEVFGETKDVQDHLDKYIRAFSFGSWVMDNSSGIQEKDFTARKLSKAESDAEVAGYRLWEHDAGEATGLVENALKEDPTLGAAHEEKGFIFFREGKDEDALQEFLRAYELDKQRYLSQYFKTMIVAKKDTPEHRNALQAGLLQTVQINPQFAPAYVQLAMLELDEGHDVRALAMSRKAEQLEPSRAGYHLLSGEILLRMNREKEAAEAATYVAERWRGPDHNEAVALWNRVPAASRPADVTIVEEVEEQSKAAEGVLRSVTCGEKGKKEVTLESGDERMVFESKGRQMIGFSDTLWYGTDHFDVCHHVEGMHAVIRYRPPVGNQYAGDWMSIELRDELPAMPVQETAKDLPAKNEDPH
jgi:tetratricopeptide (TPR) repeat protein